MSVSDTDSCVPDPQSEVCNTDACVYISKVHTPRRCHHKKDAFIATLACEVKYPAHVDACFKLFASVCRPCTIR